MGVTIRYFGPPSDAFQLAQELENQGLTVKFTPPRETRGVEEELVRVLFHIGDQGAAGLIGGTVFAAASKVVKAFRGRSGGKAEVDVQSDVTTEPPTTEAP